MTNYADKAWRLVCGFFDDDWEKAVRWFYAYNPLLCEKPANYIKSGRAEKLHKWVKAQIAENEL